MGQVTDAKPHRDGVERRVRKAQVLGIALHEEMGLRASSGAECRAARLHHRQVEVGDHDPAPGADPLGRELRQAPGPATRIEDAVSALETQQADRLRPPPPVESDAQEDVGQVVRARDGVEVLPDQPLLARPT